MLKEKFLVTFRANAMRASLNELCRMISALDEGFMCNEKEEILIERALQVTDLNDFIKFIEAAKFVTTVRSAICKFVESGRVTSPVDASALWLKIQSMLPGDEKAVVAIQSLIPIFLMDSRNLQSLGRIAKISDILLYSRDGELSAPEQEWTLIEAAILLLNDTVDLIIFLDQIKQDYFCNHVLLAYVNSGKVKFSEDVATVMESIRPQHNNEVPIMTAIMEKVLPIIKQDEAIDLDMLIRIASNIVDESNDGSDSKDFDETLIGLALPKIKSISSAIKMIKKFNTKSGKHRFISAYVKKYGIQCRDDAEILVNEINKGLIARDRFFARNAVDDVIEVAAKMGINVSLDDLIGKGHKIVPNNDLFSMFLKGIVDGLTSTISTSFLDVVPADFVEMQIEQAIQFGILAEMRIPVPGEREYTLKEFLEKKKNEMSPAHIAVFQKYIPLQEAAIAAGK